MNDKKTAERLEAAWLLREAAWALKRFADRIERACCAIDDKQRLNAEAGAHEWMKRAHERLAKFSAARRKYLGASSVVTPAHLVNGANEMLSSGYQAIPIFNWNNGKRIDPPQRIEIKCYAANRWRAGPPPEHGRKVVFIKPGIMMTFGDGFSSSMAKAWRPA